MRGRNIHSFFCLAVAGLLWSAALPGRNLYLPFTVEMEGSWDRTGATVRGGVPLPQGEVPDPADLRVLDAATGSFLPLQPTVLATWPDGSVKWVLPTFQVFGRSTNHDYVLVQDPFTSPPPFVNPIQITNTVSASRSTPDGPLLGSKIRVPAVRLGDRSG